MARRSMNGDSRWLTPAWLCMLSSLATLAGCTSDGNSVTVTGTIKQDGQPLAQATVAFVSENGSTMASGVTDSRGKFRVTVARGKNKISINKLPLSASKPKASDDEMASPTDAELAKMRSSASAEKNLSAAMADPNKSGLTCDAQPGMQSLEISL